MTPEGKIKKAVSAVFAKFEPNIDRWMPVPGGFGESRLDYAVCYMGHYIAVETKREGEKPTIRQQICIARYRRSGATVFIIDDLDGIAELEAFMDALTSCGNPYEAAGLIRGPNATRTS